MGGKWQRVAVSDIAEPVLGGTPAKAKPEYWEGGTIPWATAKDIASTNGRFIYGTEKRITWQGLANSAAKLLPLGTIVITARGTVGAIARLGREMTFNQTCYGLVPRGDDISADYLYYALNATLAEARALTYGTVFETITKKTFDSWNIPLPPLTEQRAIARILGTLDDKIELNRRMNETLEAMAQALFKSWFVDFDPVVVNALKAGNPIPDKFADRAAHYRENPDRLGLPDFILHLFPDRFVDSELGPIPEGWETGKVADLGEVICGKTPPTKDKSNYGKDIPFITIPDMHGKVYVTSTTKFLSKKGADSQRNKYIPSNSICVSCIATPGLVVLTSQVSQTNQQINAVVPERISPYYAFGALKRLGDDIRTGGSGGSVFSNLNKSRFLALRILLPSSKSIEEFHRSVQKWYERILANENESRTLASLRDALLPKLISDELRLSDVEKILEDAL